jgi:hypothetical protein
MIQARFFVAYAAQNDNKRGMEPAQPPLVCGVFASRIN